MATLAPLIVITGPTGSGKSDLAVRLAEKYDGEIVCADSRTVYKGMDIGTAKPTVEDRRRVPHHLLDVVTPDTTFTLYDFQKLAKQTIDEIRSRDHVPFLVGGTGLYIDSVVLDFELGEAGDAAERARLEDMSVNELQEMLKKHHIQFPTNPLNKRHLIRAWEQKGINIRGKSKPSSDVYVVAITTDTNLLNERIERRADQMFSGGVLQEAKELGQKYGWNSEAMSGNIYPILKQVLDGTLTETEAKQLFVIKDRQLAKRQLTWLKRHNFVKWLDLASAEDYITAVLDGRSA